MNARNSFRSLIATLFILAVAVAANAQDRQPNQTNQLHMKAKPAVVRILTGYAGQWVWRNRQWQTNYRETLDGVQNLAGNVVPADSRAGCGA